MHAAAGRADARGEALLERGLAVFVGELDLPLARGVLGAERGQALANGGQIRVGEQLLRR